MGRGPQPASPERRRAGVHVHRPAALADFLGQRVYPRERVWAAIERAVAEALYHLVQPGSQLLHPAGRDPQQVAGGDHAGQRPLGQPPVLQERREARALPQRGDRQLDRPWPASGVAADLDIGASAARTP